MELTTIILILVALNIAVTLWLWKGMAQIYMHTRCTHNTLHGYLEHQSQTESMFEHVMHRLYDDFEQNQSTSVQDWDDGDTTASEE